jgi:hypothetical protein
MGVRIFMSSLGMKLIWSIKGWRKKWIYLRSDVSPPLPVFTSNRPIYRPS